MNIEELITELQKFGRKDAIVVTSELIPIRKLQFVNQGVEGTSSIFTFIRFLPIQPNTTYPSTFEGMSDQHEDTSDGLDRYEDERDYS